MARVPSVKATAPASRSRPSSGGSLLPRQLPVRSRHMAGSWTAPVSLPRYDQHMHKRRIVDRRIAVRQCGEGRHPTCRGGGTG